MKNKIEVKAGDRFGKLTIINEDSTRYNRRAFKCKCDCGNEIIVKLCSLRGGLTKSCGCLRTNKKIYNEDKTKKKCWKCGKLLNLDEFYKNISKSDGLTSECKSCCNKLSTEKYHKLYNDKDFDVLFRYSHYKSDAKRRDKEFILSIDEFDNITSKPCYICGKYTNGSSYSGIDRLDNEIGYVLSNCIPCCDKCNRIKYTYTLEDTFKHLSDIYKFQKSKGNIICR